MEIENVISDNIVAFMPSIMGFASWMRARSQTEASGRDTTGFPPRKEHPTLSRVDALARDCHVLRKTFAGPSSPLGRWGAAPEVELEMRDSTAVANREDRDPEVRCFICSIRKKVL